MAYLSVEKTAEKWGISQRSVRNYCAQGRIAGAKRIGKTWYIPEDAQKPGRIARKKAEPTLLQILAEQKAARMTGGIYHKVQIDLTYNSNHIEGSRLTHDQTRYIFETNTIGIENEAVNIDDILETANHFRCIDMVIDKAHSALTEKFIKELHFVLKTGTSDSRKDWFNVGEYKKLPNEAGIPRCRKMLPRKWKRCWKPTTPFPVRASRILWRSMWPLNGSTPFRMETAVLVG